MPTKANQAANAALKDATRRANRKLKRLQKKGIRTGSISPIRPVDTSDTRAVKKYTKELENFISRQTRFVRGRDGSPIPYEYWRDFKRLERDYNRTHAKFWSRFGDMPFLTTAGASDMTLRERDRMLQRPLIERRADVQPDQINSMSDLKRRAKTMLKEISPNYQANRMKQLRKNLLEHSMTYNDSRLPRMIRSLSEEQLFALQAMTNFVPVYFHFISTEVNVSLGEMADEMEHEAQVQHLIDTIEQVQTFIPSVKLTSTATKEQKKKGKGKTRGRVRVTGFTPESVKQRARTIYQKFYK